MNTKIKSLAERAGFQFGKWTSSDNVYVESELNRFANLIIEECALAADQHQRSFSTSSDGAACSGAANAVRQIGKSNESA